MSDMVRFDDRWGVMHCSVPETGSSSAVLRAIMSACPQQGVQAHVWSLPTTWTEAGLTAGGIETAVRLAIQAHHPKRVAVLAPKHVSLDPGWPWTGGTNHATCERQCFAPDDVPAALQWARGAPLDCPWCHRRIQDGEGPATYAVCQSCHDQFLATGAGVQEVLDAIDAPVVIVDKAVRVLSGNRASGQPRAEAGPGPLLGEAAGCRYASLPGGCGGTAHCTACVVRSLVTDTLQTGRAHSKVTTRHQCSEDASEQPGPALAQAVLVSTVRLGGRVLVQLQPGANHEPVSAPLSSHT